MSLQVRATGGSLKKAGVTLVSQHVTDTMRCDCCGREWTEWSGTAKRRSRRFYHCPAGCNVGDRKRPFAGLVKKFGIVKHIVGRLAA
jgi:hypothetical protein